jgi:hypothetical protein
VVTLTHYQHNVGHICFPTIIHDKPKSIRDQEKAARKEARQLLRYQECKLKFEGKAHKAQVSRLMKC